MHMQPDMLVESIEMRKNASVKSARVEYIQNIPGRLRIRIETLRSNPLLCSKVMESLSGIHGILAVTANHYTAKALIIYNSNIVSLNEIENSLSDILNTDKKQKTGKGKVIKANFKFNKVLTYDEFMNSRNVLSKEYRSFNVNALHNSAMGVKRMNSWYDLTVEEAEERLNTNAVNGITREEAKLRLKKFGLNQFEKHQKKSFLSMLLSKFDGFIIKTLLAASGISLLLGQVADAATILVIVGIEAFIGIWQEHKAEKSLNLLKDLSTPVAAVIRDGIKMHTPARQLVPGDVLCLEAGNVVPADARLIESQGLQAIESSLTGEAYPVYKRNTDIPYRDVPLGDRSNMVYMGTSIVKGSGKAIVVATGMQTEIGRIAGMLGSSEQEKTPLQKDIDRLAKFITWGCLGICGIITIGGIIGGNPITSMFATGVSLAVGAIPEGLTTVLAISLAFGAQRMAKKNAIVKFLPSMETLSCTKVICTDKTGTLTRNEMTVKYIYTLDKSFNVSGEGYHSRGYFTYNGRRISASEHADLKTLMTAAALCNNAELVPSGNKSYNIKGDPTEAALLISVEKSGVQLEEFECYKREHEIPFDPEARKMTAICSDKEGNRFVYVKGAIDSVINKCSKIMTNGYMKDLTPNDIRQIQYTNNIMADKAMRILALAYKPLKKNIYPVDSPEIEEGLVFLGLVGITDPPRPEVKSAIKKCHDAGIKVVMITGDHKNTAAAIAKSIGLLTDKGMVLSSEDVEHMTEEELSNIIDRVEVFARSCPEQKLKIVKAFKNKGHIVAMTGDGVNDAPALKEAHIGIAMGQSGTDIAKDASSIILTDDNFNTVVKAVEEGRTVNRNIKKFMKYVLSGNLAGVLSIFLASISGLPSPLIPAQILMLNLITEGIPALSLGVDPPEDNIMNELPRDPNKSIFDRKIMSRIIIRGIATGLTTVGIFSGVLFLTGSLLKARTMAFANMVSCQMLHAFECSSMGIRKNKYLLPSVAISTAIMLANIYIPAVAGVFGMVSLNPLNWAVILFSAIVLNRIDNFIKDMHPRLSESFCGYAFPVS